MESRGKILGHPPHMLLVAFPIGLLATSVIFDTIALVKGEAVMATVAYWLMAAGAIGALVAAPFGFVDWLAIPKGTRAKAVGAAHGIGNVIVLLLYAGSWLARRNNVPDPGNAAHVLSYAGLGLALVTAWLGGELVVRMGVGIDDGADLDAPSTLSGSPAKAGPVLGPARTDRRR